MAYNLKSAKFEHLFASQRDLTQSLQQKMEEAWVGRTRDLYPFPLSEAKNAIRQLRLRLVDYILAVQAEIMPSSADLGPAVENPNTSAAAISLPTTPTLAPTPVPYSFPIAAVGGGTGGNASPRVTGPTYFGGAFGNNVVRLDDWNY